MLQIFLLWFGPFIFVFAAFFAICTLFLCCLNPCMLKIFSKNLQKLSHVS
ncbi:hypothetical protein MtrunA17_Chr7g0241471 [Medicago truncatula]|uniref:Transmembrane protein n=1 Tax=Medicago truncatula TaxID=3880 RepID=A0A396H5Y5_MEDTR|nr:hypothetical protein MtrunA17_Chr7g0241471 [Medicago truncatula]